MNRRTFFTHNRTNGYCLSAVFSAFACAVFCAALLSCAAAPTPRKTYEQASGTVTAVEKYGHLVTDVPFEHLLNLGYEYGDIVTVTFGNNYQLTAPIVKKYEVDKGKPLVRTEYADGNISFCINYGNLAKEGKLAIGDSFTLRMLEKGGYADDFEALDVTRTDERADYQDDAVFANFREVTVGSIAPHVLYRGSHPTKTRWPRAPFAAALMEKAGIATVINMSDTEEQLKTTYLADSNPYASSYYAALTDKGSVICLAMGMDFNSTTFTANIAKALQFMRTHDAPYYIHCNEGKDRTGFIFILLEALMGADSSAIYADYMTSYENFYHVQPNSKKYTLILQKNAVPMLQSITMNRKDTAQAAEDFLVSNGMSTADIAALKAKLAAK